MADETNDSSEESPEGLEVQMLKEAVVILSATRGGVDRRRARPGFRR